MNDILYQKSPAMFRNNPVAFIVAIALIPMFGIGLAILAAWWLSSKPTRMTISREHFLLERGIFSKDRIEFPVSAVRTVHIRQSFLNRLLSVGAVDVIASGDRPEASARGMPNPNEIRRLLLH